LAFFGWGCIRSDALLGASLDTFPAAPRPSGEFAERTFVFHLLEYLLQLSFRFNEVVTGWVGEVRVQVFLVHAAFFPIAVYRQSRQQFDREERAGFGVLLEIPQLSVMIGNQVIEIGLVVAGRFWSALSRVFHHAIFGATLTVTGHLHQARRGIRVHDVWWIFRVSSPGVLYRLEAADDGVGHLHHSNVAESRVPLVRSRRLHAGLCVQPVNHQYVDGIRARTVATVVVANWANAIPLFGVRVEAQADGAESVAVLGFDGYLAGWEHAADGQEEVSSIKDGTRNALDFLVELRGVREVVRVARFSITECTHLSSSRVRFVRVCQSLCQVDACCDATEISVRHPPLSLQQL
jgi:hypothetical protein